MTAIRRSAIRVSICGSRTRLRRRAERAPRTGGLTDASSTAGQLDVERVARAVRDHVAAQVAPNSARSPIMSSTLCRAGSLAKRRRFSIGPRGPNTSKSAGDSRAPSPCRRNSSASRLEQKRSAAGATSVANLSGVMIWVCVWRSIGEPRP